MTPDRIPPERPQNDPRTTPERLQNDLRMTQNNAEYLRSCRNPFYRGGKTRIGQEERMDQGYNPLSFFFSKLESRNSAYEMPRPAALKGPYKALKGPYKALKKPYKTL